MDDLSTIRSTALGAIEQAADLAALDAARVAALGKKGSVTGLMKTLGGLAPDQRKEFGARVNQLKGEIEQAFDARRSTLGAFGTSPCLTDSTRNGDASIAASVSLGSPVRVGARDHNGAVYVIAVNASRAPTTATITVPALGDRVLLSLDGQHRVTAAGGSFTDTFGSLEARVYVAAPAQGSHG